MPVAQTFKIKNLPNKAPGIFVTSIGVYFRTVDTNVGVNILLAETVNGIPNHKRILSRARKNPGTMNGSADASIATTFVLENPIYLMSNKEYCFILQPDGNSPNFNIWTGETGGYDVDTGEQVFSNPYSGTMYISANRSGWTAIQNEDIKFVLYRAKFSNSAGTVVLKKESDENLVVDGFTRANSSIAINVGDIVYTVNSAANTSNVASIVSNTLATAVSGRVQYISEETGELFLDSSTANSTSYFSNTTNPLIAVYDAQEVGNTSQVTSNNLIAYGTVQEVKDLKYHSVVPKISTVSPARTYVSYEHKGVSNTNVLDTSYVSVQKDKTFEYPDYERVILSRSNEVNEIDGEKSSEYRIALRTDNDYVSPVINLGQKSSLYIENLISNEANNEHTKIGNALTKYVSKKVVLADGQDSEDLKVYVTAYKPYDTDIKVYAKFWNSEDPETFDSKVWTELEYDEGGELVYSADGSNSFKEYSFSVPSSNSVDYAAFANTTTESLNLITGTVSISNNSNILQGSGTSFDTELEVGDRIKVISNDYFAIRTVVDIANSTYMTVDLGVKESNSSSVGYVFAQDAGNDGIVEYYNTSNSRFIGYKEFALKVVLLSSNAVKYPKVDDIRAISLMV